MITNVVDMPEDERKKALKKIRKADAKKTTVAIAAGSPASKDETFGSTFVAGVDHLQEATKFLNPLIQQRQDDLSTWLYACKVYAARGKFPLLVRSINRAFSIDPKAPFIHYYLTKLMLGIDRSPPDATVKKVIMDVITVKHPNYISKEKIKSLNATLVESNDPATYLYSVMTAKLINSELAIPSFFEAPGGERFNNFDLPVIYSNLASYRCYFGD